MKWSRGGYKLIRTLHVDEPSRSLLLLRSQLSNLWLREREHVWSGVV